jgi:tape measure domain-containing protein
MDDSKTLELQIRIAAQEAVRAVSSLKDEIQNLASEAKKFSETDGAALEKSFKDAETAAKDSVSSIGEIKKAIGSLTEVVAATKALSFIKDLGVFALKTADNFQTAKNQFGTLLGDMEAGAGLFNEIKAFNDVTPFDLDTLTQATNVLISAKVPLEDLQNQLTKFGDLSQGNSQRMTSYVNAFSQAAAKGKADMQILNTYLHQGVPILDELAKNFGTTTEEIVKMSSDGKISFADFSKALDDLTAAGGQYFGGMELASKSLAAMQEGLKEATNSLAASFGDMLLPMAIAVVCALTEITNAINDSPILKGLFAGALVAIAGYLTVMAVKAGIAFAQQMALNFAIGAVNPVVLAATVAVAGIAAAYVAQAAGMQKAQKESENFSIALRKQSKALYDASGAVKSYAESFNGMSGEAIARRMREVEYNMKTIPGIIERNEQEIKRIRDKYDEEGRAFDTTPEIEKLEKEISNAKLQLEAARAEWNAIQEGYRQYRNPVEEVTPIDEKAAEKWFKQWAEEYAKFKAEISGNPFAELEREYKIKIGEAESFNADKTVINQINEYYKAERSKIIKELKEEEERLEVSLSKTKIDDLKLQKRLEEEKLTELEQKRIFSAIYTEEEIAKIRKHFNEMREDIDLKFKIEIDKTKLDEARDAVKNWQEELSNSLLRGIMDIGIFADQASVIISDLTSQLIELSASATLSGFEEFGRAIGEGEDAADSMSRALAAMAEQILKQLPMMFLQAGLQLIANGQWPLGLSFIAAAGSSAIISGYVDGEKAKASKHAQGGVFDEYGQAARTFAAGGAFTNQIVSSPTYFAHGSGFGLMGEAGPEAIMPLTRMPNGNLGVQTAGGSANVIVNIINNSGAEVRQEETETADGAKQIDITIGEMINRHITSGKADRVMGRYGLRVSGV